MKNINSKYIPLLSFTLIIILIIYGCTKKIINDNDNSQIPMAMNAKLSSSELASFIDYFTLTISADDIDTIVAELTLEGSIIKGTVQVPIGSDRKFVLEALDDTTVIYRGITIMNVTGEDDTISVDMSPAVSLIRLSHRYLEINNDSLLTLNVRVFNVPDLHSLSVKVFYDSLFLIPDSAVSGININPDSTYFADSLFANETYLSLSLEHINPFGTLVDTNGNADVATLYFSQVVSSFNRTTAITIEPVELVNLTGDTISPGEVYTDSSLINIVFSDTLLIVNPEILQFKALFGGSNPVPKTIAVNSQAIDSISYSASEDLTWMNLINQTGETPDEIIVNVNISGLSDSIYPGIITITSPQASNSPLDIPVTLEILLDTIVAPQPPQWPIGWMMRFGYDSISHVDTVGIMLLWTGNSNMKGYNVYRSISNEPFVTINDTLIIDNPYDTIYPNIFYIDYNIDSLSIDTHRYYVTAVNNADVESEASDTISLVPGDILDSMTVEQDIQVYLPQHRWFTSESPAFSWEPVLDAESYLLLLLVGNWHSPKGDTAIWSYRDITTNIILGETQGITYIPLPPEYSSLIIGEQYKFETYAINNDRTVYKHGVSEFVVVGPDGFTGITETDESGIVVFDDPYDWCRDCPTSPDYELPVDFCFLPAYPNPANTSTIMTFELPIATNVQLYIIDNIASNFTIIKNLMDEFIVAGVHSIQWDLTDNNGVRVDPGIYRCLIETGDYFWCYGDIQVTGALPPQPPQWPLGWLSSDGSGNILFYILWKDNSANSNVKGYNIYESINDDLFETLNSTLITTGFDYESYFYVDSNIDYTSSLVHKYYITAVNYSDVESAASDSIILIPQVIHNNLDIERIQNLYPEDGWFASNYPTFNWDSLLIAQSFILVMDLWDSTSSNNDTDTAIWLYRDTSTSIPLGETQGITYFPLLPVHYPLMGGSKYWYQVNAINDSNAVFMFGESVFEAVGPEGFTGVTETNDSGDVITVDPNDWCGVSAPYPNPAKHSITIPFEVPVLTTVQVLIINSSFATVKNLIDTVLEAGMDSVSWNLTDNSAIRVIPGIYRCIILAGDYQCYGDIEILQLDPPGIPALAFPDSGSVNVPNNPTLCWHPSVNAGYYEFEMDTTDLFTVIPIGGITTDTCSNFDFLNNSTTYYWRVRANNTVGQSDWSNIWVFTTESIPGLDFNK